ncbi:MAG: hypothetical protein ACLPN5_22485 [Roseiarcus sp.]
MTSPTQTKATPNPTLLVYGKPTSPDLPQASWFRAEDKEAAKAAAQSLKFSVIDIQTDAEKALTVGVHEGVLKGSGRMIVGSVTPEVFRRIEDYVRKASGGDASPRASAVQAAAEPTSEQTVNLTTAGTEPSAPAPKSVAPASPDSKPAAAAISATTSTGKPEITNAASPNPWDTLRVGARVLAAYWGETHAFEGFWLATVKRIDQGEFTLEWFAAPEYPAFKTAPKNIAVPHPEFRPSGK